MTSSILKYFYRCLSLLTFVLASNNLKSQPQLLDTLKPPDVLFNSYFGFSVSDIGGDVNNDGVFDIVVGAYGDHPTSSFSSGEGHAYILSGASGQIIHTLFSGNAQSSGYFGWSVSGTGADVTRDGIADVVVGAIHEDPGSSPQHAGRAYIINGKTGAVVRTLVSPNETYHGYFGHAVSEIGGDVNGDTIPDIIIGAYRESSDSSPYRAGRAYIISGASGSIIHTLKSPNEESSGEFGYAVSGVGGDLNGDSIPDVIVGAIREEPLHSPDGAGRAYIFCSASGALIRELDTPNPRNGGWFGFSVSGIHDDVNNDGVIDIVVAAHREDPGPSPEDAGRVYIISGATGAVLHTTVSPNEEFQGMFGHSVSQIGSDLNGDGIYDILVGARNEDPCNSPTGAGRAYILSGANGAVLMTIASPSEQQHGLFGYSVSGIGGDVNGNGVNDVVIGAHRESFDSSSKRAGRAYIFDVSSIPPVTQGIVTTHISICMGDSLFVGGSYQKVSGVYYDTFSISTCDTILITNLTVAPLYMDTMLFELCPGDSVFVDGSYQHSPGVYYDTFSLKGCDSVLVTILNSGCKLKLKAILGGCYDVATGLMNDDLRSENYIPLNEPFTDLGFSHHSPGGNEEIQDPSILEITGDNAIVDWIFIELRDKTDSTIVVTTKSALIQRDGDIVDTDGVSPIIHTHISSDNYYVIVKHRNHLGIMTKNPISLSALDVTTIDFSNDTTEVFGTNPQEFVGDRHVMWAGNAYIDEYIRYSGVNNDRDVILQKIGGIVPTNTVFGYHTEDINLNGIVQYSGLNNDRDIILQNIDGVVPTNVVIEQIP